MKKKVMALFVLCILLLVACGKSEATTSTSTQTTEPTTVVENPVVEEPETKVEEPETTVEEPEPEVEEHAEVALSTEEWIESLNLDTYTIIVINTITREKRVLNDGEHYTLVKGDKFGYFLPEGWTFKDASMSYINGFIDEPLCTFFELDYSNIPNDYEWKDVVEDERFENDATVTVYITVDPSLK